jgi:hypothetical protein
VLIAQSLLLFDDHQSLAAGGGAVKLSIDVIVIHKKPVDNW